MSDRQETDRRLHPLSILFDIAGTVRSFIVPVVIAVFASRSERILIYSSAIIGSLSIIGAIWNWFTYRFRYDENDLVVRSGKFIRNERHIPYNRIHKIDAVQSTPAIYVRELDRPLRNFHPSRYCICRHASCCSPA